MRRLLHRPVTGLTALVLLLSLVLPLHAQDKRTHQPRDAHETHDTRDAAKPSANAAAPSLLPADAVTHHKLRLGSQEIAYTATAGTLPLRDDKGEKQADIFYVAFLRDGVADVAKRPITYAFNGGPGAASAYLDIGAMGPRALDFGASGKPEPAIDRVGDNPDTWLPFTDLVFIDPVGTGYSRAMGGGDGAKKFWNVHADLDALAQIVRLHLTRVDRLNSPVYLVGESYGGFRAARLAHQLARQEGIAAAGVMLVSPALEFRLMGGDEFDVLPWALRLPSYAAVALEAKGALSPEGLAEVEHFALNDYLVALAAGGGDATRADHLYATIAQFIGLDAGMVARWRGRVPTGAYVKEMRRRDGQILSRYDGSVAGADPSPHSYQAEEDPVLQGSIAPFTRAFLAYARNELGFSTELGYELLNNDVSRHWEWGDGGRRSLGAADALRRALALQPRLRVLIAHGMTDLVTPYMTSRYVVDHLPANLTGSRVELKLYAGGHMMYLRSASRRRLHDDAQAFYQPDAAQ
jgi:carboxypeptidase C (cathepsin A)